MTTIEQPETGVPPEISMDAISALRGAILILSRRLRHQQAGDELSPSESAVLARIGRSGPMTPGQLARCEHVQPPSMTRIIERLETRGYLRREPDPADRRQILVSRTPAGDEFAAQSRAVRTAWLSRQVGKLDLDQQRALAAAASALTALADQE
ncbi:DNA-binding transcriptional regulator, MarR family [Nakamurella panacisegetis]|uniref:DNA-binding transcriptional regulator, MarR family n=1 Tax=Nakamurella panacisegetis TaxID=1090615 RepID=A0A1H0Q4Y6_9ACTN|nr:MarR family transcriptional regulator [Nakamurella panacisegetis]SDP11738.1 DNA-binding transcriptional regulator, MarR family [Nakamurella panacisegetis]